MKASSSLSWVLIGWASFLLHINSLWSSFIHWLAWWFIVDLPWFHPVLVDFLLDLRWTWEVELWLPSSVVQSIMLSLCSVCASVVNTFWGSFTHYSGVFFPQLVLHLYMWGVFWQFSWVSSRDWKGTFSVDYYYPDVYRLASAWWLMEWSCVHFVVHSCEVLCVPLWLWFPNLFWFAFQVISRFALLVVYFYIFALSRASVNVHGWVIILFSQFFQVWAIGPSTLLFPFCCWILVVSVGLFYLRVG